MPLTLFSLQLGGDETETNWVTEPVVVAYVMGSPDVHEESGLRLLSTTPELRINGSFMGAAKVRFTFQPPVVEGVHYDDLTQYPITSLALPVVLRLRPGRRWRKNAGLLYLTSVDTGPGKVDMRKRIANVVDALDSNVTVECVAQPIYHDSPQLTITGSGFTSANDSFVFADSDSNRWFYSVTSASASSHTLTLRDPTSSFWRNALRRGPRPLTLLSVKTELGYVPVGRTTAHGCDVAMVYLKPSIEADLHSGTLALSWPELNIRGEGFPSAQNTSSAQRSLALRFDPPLTLGVDYTLEPWLFYVAELHLLPGRSWRHDPGVLKVTHANTLGVEYGWCALPHGGTVVAMMVQDDDIFSHFGDVVFISSRNLVYQSALEQQIVIRGVNFPSGIALNFSPTLRVDVDYTLNVSSTHLVVSLKERQEVAR